jgi:hypothetical protein
MPAKIAGRAELKKGSMENFHTAQEEEKTDFAGTEIYLVNT